ncbi:MAG: DnaD domain protein [Evtepia sp.]
MIYDFLGLPPEVILTLAGWCNEKAKRAAPAAHHPALIRREAVKWEKAGITTLDAADAHLSA